jgi:hypothetical protein
LKSHVPFRDDGDPKMRITGPTGDQLDEIEPNSFPQDEVEPFLTIKDAAKRLGIPAFKLQRAARTQLIPSYRFLNGRILVRLSEVIASIEATWAGGAR